MSFDDNERSVQQNRPIDLYTITTPTDTFHHTSHPVDVPYAGQIYTALTMSRGTQQISNDHGIDEQTVTLPITHLLVQRYAATGIPQMIITVTIQRLQTVSGSAQQIFTGFAQGLTVDGHTATIRCPASTADTLKIQLPVVGATRICNHRLFDRRCSPNPGGHWPLTDIVAGSGGPDPTLFRVPDTVVTVSSNGLTITGSAIGSKPSGWAALGRIIVPATTEQRRILTHTGSTITLAVPIVGLAAGVNVTIETGCDHSYSTCGAKFNNVQNFGGHPNMSNFNPWHSNGLGVIQQV